MASARSKGAAPNVNRSPARRRSMPLPLPIRVHDRLGLGTFGPAARAVRDGKWCYH
jgi:hypothetical protein